MNPSSSSHTEKCSCETCKSKAYLETLAKVKASAEAAYSEGYSRGVALVNTATTTVATMAGEAVGATVAAAATGVATVKEVYSEKPGHEKVNAVKGVVEERVPGALDAAQSALNVGWGIVGAVTKMVKDNMPPVAPPAAAGAPSVEIVEENVAVGGGGGGFQKQELVAKQ
ncbi:hypothetical protein TYRP_021050 [Tyrophagus putrescentiae]|nr:hypothetical protein TYRP_021050 [Tyrophagus putrescentiae]